MKMKKTKKLWLTILGAALSAVMLFGVAACGNSESAATLTGTYMSENKITYMNMLPTYNYYTLNSTTQQLETFDDNTYCLTVTVHSYSNVSFGPDVATGQETWNDRGQTVTKYYGTCTSQLDAEDSELMFVTIAKPTRMVYAARGSQYFDTANWTQDMTDRASKKDSDGNVTETVDAAAYLNAKVENFAAEGIEIMVTLSSGNFDAVTW